MITHILTESEENNEKNVRKVPTDRLCKSADLFCYRSDPDGDRRDLEGGNCMKIVIKEPNEKPRSTFVPRGGAQLHILQNLVDGYIEVYPILDDLLLIIDEEGKLKDKPMNFFIPNDYIAGTAVFVGKDGEDFTDCPYSVEEIEVIIEELDV